MNCVMPAANEGLDCVDAGLGGGVKRKSACTLRSAGSAPGLTRPTSSK